MSDKTALLMAVWDQPDDDTPRLVYADWLQENGEEERAEFIRVSCALANATGKSRKESGELTSRQSALWRQGLQEAFHAELMGVLGEKERLHCIIKRQQPRQSSVVVRRGFPEILEMHEFIKQSAVDRMLLHWPIRKVYIGNLANTFTQLESAASERICELEIHTRGNSLEDEREILRGIRQCRHLMRLQMLTIAVHWIDSDEEKEFHRLIQAKRRTKFPALETVKLW